MEIQLIDQLTSVIDPSQHHHTNRERLEAAIEAKIEGYEVQFAGEPEEPAKVTDLMEALRASVEEAKSRRSA